MKATGNSTVGIIPGLLNLVRPFAMLDLESLGTKSHHPIIEIGICFYKNGVFISRSEYVQPDWTLADPETIKWWRKQDHWEKICANVDRYGHWSVQKALQQLLEDFQIKDGINTHDELLNWYALGPQFDMSMLERQAIGDMPWHFRKVRDLRTTFDDLNMGERPKVELLQGSDFISHSAKDDAERQARQLVHIQQRTPIQTTMNLAGR